MGGATGGGVGVGGGGGAGTATGGLFGMSAAAPSFVQTSQLAPFLLSQMGPQGSWGELCPRVHVCVMEGGGGGGVFVVVRI